MLRQRLIATNHLNKDNIYTLKIFPENLQFNLLWKP